MDDLVCKLLAAAEHKVRNLRRCVFNDRARKRYYNSEPLARRVLLRKLPKPVAKVVLANLHDRPLDEDEASLTTTSQSCNCKFSVNWRLPCYHVIIFRESRGMSLNMNLSERWIGSIPDVGSPVTHLTQVTRTPGIAKRTSSPAQKIAKARPFMDIIEQSLLAGGEAVFNHRFAVIKFISECFQQPGKIFHYSTHC